MQKNGVKNAAQKGCVLNTVGIPTVPHPAGLWPRGQCWPAQGALPYGCACIVDVLLGRVPLHGMPPPLGLHLAARQEVSGHVGMEAGPAGKVGVARPAGWILGEAELALER